MTTTGSLPGFYGKMPSLGDFVSRNLSREFMDPWDAWLQSCLAMSREGLGDDWLESYLTSPIWRFVLSPSLCGPCGWAGAMMPSVDRVGRNFPLAIAAALDDDAEPFEILRTAQPWFNQAESTLLSALDDEGFEIDAFEQQVAALGAVLTSPPGARLEPAPTGMPWRIGLDDLAHAQRCGSAILGATISAGYGAYSLWWTAGSEHVRPSMLVCMGLPPATGYVSMLVGQWQVSGWHDASPEPLNFGGDAGPGEGAET